MSSVRKRSRSAPQRAEDVTIQTAYHVFALATDRFEEGSVPVDQPMLFVEHAHHVAQVVEDHVTRDGDEIQKAIAEEPSGDDDVACGEGERADVAERPRDQPEHREAPRRTWTRPRPITTAAACER